MLASQILRGSVDLSSSAWLANTVGAFCPLCDSRLNGSKRKDRYVWAQRCVQILCICPELLNCKMLFTDVRPEILEDVQQRESNLSNQRQHASLDKQCLSHSCHSARERSANGCYLILLCACACVTSRIVLSGHVTYCHFVLVLKQLTKKLNKLDISCLMSLCLRGRRLLTCP